MEKQITSKSQTAFFSQKASLTQASRHDVLEEASRRAARYLAKLEERPVFPTPKALAGLAAFDEALPEDAQDPLQTLALLDDAGSPATVTSAGGRYFGFVIGGALPATLAANWLAGAWDQNAGLKAASPVSGEIGTGGVELVVGCVGLAGGVRGRLCHRGDDGKLQRAGCGPARRSQAGGLGRGSARACLARRRSQ